MDVDSDQEIPAGPSGGAVGCKVKIIIRSLTPLLLLTSAYSWLKLPDGLKPFISGAGKEEV